MRIRRAIGFVGLMVRHLARVPVGAGPRRVLPEVIVINDYGDTGAEAERAFPTSFPPPAGVCAIRNDRILVLDRADLVESPRDPAAITALAAYLRGGQSG